MRRAIAAYLAVALAFPALILVLGLHHALGGAAIAISVLLMVVLLLGLPTLIMFCKLQWWEPWRFVAGGAMGGMLCAVPFLAAASFSPWSLIVMFAVFGVGFSAIFWFAGIWRNDNLTCPREFALPGGARFRVARGLLKKPLGADSQT
jgi:hypothetical protein